MFKPSLIQIVVYVLLGTIVLFHQSTTFLGLWILRFGMRLAAKSIVANWVKLSCSKRRASLCCSTSLGLRTGKSFPNVLQLKLRPKKKIGTPKWRIYMCLTLTFIPAFRPKFHHMTCPRLWNIAFKMEHFAWATRKWMPLPLYGWGKTYPAMAGVWKQCLDIHQRVLRGTTRYFWQTRNWCWSGLTLNSVPKVRRLLWPKAVKPFIHFIPTLNFAFRSLLVSD